MQEDQENQESQESQENQSQFDQQDFDGSTKDSGSKDATEEKSEGDKILQNISGKIHATRDVLIAGTIGELHQHLANEGGTQKLTLDRNFDLLDEVRLREEWTRLHFDPDHVGRLAARLKDRRILILAGDPEIGKRSLALLVAFSVGSNLRSSAEACLKETALCRHVPGRLRVDFADLTGREDEFRQRVLILKNPFSSGNEDVLRFVTELSGSRLESYVASLRRNDSFLLLTADLPSLPGSRDKLKGLGILEYVERPSAQDLEEGLKLLVGRFMSDQSIPPGDPLPEQVERLIAEKGSLLATELASLSRLSRFIREYLLEVAREPDRFQDALKRTVDLSHWLLEDLSGEPEVWCTVVALIICSADRSLEGIPWFEFDTLRRAISGFLRRELRKCLKRRGLRELCRTELTLKRARAEVVPGSYPRRDVIRFLDERYSDWLWQALLGPGKGITAELVPLLRELTADHDSYLRESSAQALGRIGRIDPFYITYPLMNEWLDPGRPGNELKRGTLLGSLFEGIWSANEDIGYQQGCLRILRSRARSENTQTVRVVVFSLYKIASIDRDGLELALGILRNVAEKRLKIEWKDLHDFTKEFRTDEQLTRFVEFVYKSRGELDQVRKKAVQALHAIAVSNAAILDAFGYCLYRLLLWHQLQGEGLRRLLDWVQTSPDHLGPLMAFAFLGDGGIAYWLDWTVSGHKAGRGVREEGSPLLEAIRQDPGLAIVLIAFVEALFLQIRKFPGLLREALEKNFLRLLAGWAREGRSIGHLQISVTEILLQLYKSRDEELSDRILRLAQEPAAAPELEDLRALAIEAITGRRGPGTPS